MDEIQQLFEALNVEAQSGTGDDQKNKQTKPNISQLGMTVRLLKEHQMHDFVSGFVVEIVTSIPKDLKSNDSEAQKDAAQCLLQVTPMLGSIMLDAKKRDVVFKSAMDCFTIENKNKMEMKLIGLKILTALVEDYYAFMDNYFRGIFKITTKIIDQATKDETTYGDLGKNAIEFWLVCAEQEVECLRSTGNDHDAIPNASKHLFPLCLEILQRPKDENTYDWDAWTMRSAAGCLIERISLITKDKLLQTHSATIEKFIIDNQTSKNPQKREALAALIGAIVQGLPQDSLLEFLTKKQEKNLNGKRNLLQFIVNCTRIGNGGNNNSNESNETNNKVKDKELIVKHSGSWAFARIANVCPECIMTSSGLKNVDEVVDLLLPLIRNGTIKQVDHACWCLSTMLEYWSKLRLSNNSSENNYKNKNNNDKNKNKNKNKNGITKGIVEKIIDGIVFRITKENSVGKEVRACHELLNTVILSTTIDDKDVSLKLMDLLFQRLEFVINNTKRLIDNGNNSKQQNTNEKKSNDGDTKKHSTKNNNKNEMENEKKSDSDSEDKENEDIIVAVASAAGCFSNLNVIVDHLTTQWYFSQGQMSDGEKPVPFFTNKLIEKFVSSMVEFNQIPNILFSLKSEANIEGLKLLEMLSRACKDAIFVVISKNEFQSLLVECLKQDSNVSSDIILIESAAEAICVSLENCRKQVESNASKVQLFVDNSLQCLLTHISNIDMPLSMKPRLISSITQICDSFGKESVRYWRTVIGICCNFAREATKQKIQASGSGSGNGNGGVRQLKNRFLDQDTINDINSVRSETMAMIEYASFSYHMLLSKSEYEFIKEFETPIFLLLKAMVDFGTHNDCAVLKRSYDLIDSVCSGNDIRVKDKFRNEITQNLLNISKEKDEDGEEGLLTKAKKLYEVQCIGVDFYFFSFFFQRD